MGIILHKDLTADLVHAPRVNGTSITLDTMGPPGTVGRAEINHAGIIPQRPLFFSGSAHRLESYALVTDRVVVSGSSGQLISAEASVDDVNAVTGLSSFPNNTVAVYNSSTNRLASVDYDNFIRRNRDNLIWWNGSLAFEASPGVDHISSPLSFYTAANGGELRIQGNMGLGGFVFDTVASFGSNDSVPGHAVVFRSRLSSNDTCRELLSIESTLEGVEIRVGRDDVVDSSERPDPGYLVLHENNYGEYTVECPTVLPQHDYIIGRKLVEHHLSMGLNTLAFEAADPVELSSIRSTSGGVLSIEGATGLRLNIGQFGNAVLYGYYDSAGAGEAYVTLRYCHGPNTVTKLSTEAQGVLIGGSVRQDANYASFNREALLVAGAISIVNAPLEFFGEVIGGENIEHGSGGNDPHDSWFRVPVAGLYEFSIFAYVSYPQAIPACYWRITLRAYDNDNPEGPLNPGVSILFVQSGFCENDAAPGTRYGAKLIEFPAGKYIRARLHRYIQPGTDAILNSWIAIKLINRS